jgi:acetoin utilization deacetylase AcuC-like enzyme
MPGDPYWWTRASRLRQAVAMERTALLLYDDAMVDHQPGWGHPERPERLLAIEEALRADPVDGATWERPTPAPEEPVRAVHIDRHLGYLESLRGRSGMVDGDTTVSAGSIDAAWLAAGAAVRSVDAVLAGEYGSAFALVRPPGHHAEADRGMGFCLINNVAVAAEHARARGCERVLIVDWDVHHGNGTQHSFAERDDVLFFSVHRHPFYPGSGGSHFVGRGTGEGHNVNVPLSRHVGDAGYLSVFEEILVPVAQEYDPDLILVSAGFDAHHADPLGGMGVTDEGFAALCGVVLGLADRCCDGRVALTLEGGYDLEGLAGSVRACVEVLCGATAPSGFAGADEVDHALPGVREIQRRWWPV